MARPNSSTAADRRQRRDRRDAVEQRAPTAASPPDRRCRARPRRGGGPSPRRCGRRAGGPCAPATPTPRRWAPARTRRRSSPSGRPRSLSMVRTTSSNGNGPTSSCSSASAVEMYSGMRSGRVLMIWPTLMKVAPELAERDPPPPARARPAAAPRPNAAARAAQPAHPEPDPVLGEQRADDDGPRRPAASGAGTSRTCAGILYYAGRHDAACPRPRTELSGTPAEAPAVGRPGSPTSARTIRARRWRCGSGGSPSHPGGRRLPATSTEDAWQDDDLPRGGRGRAGDRRRPGRARGRSRRPRLPACRRRGSSGCSATSAILLAGGVTVPIYASNTAEQCEFIVRDAGAKIVLVEDAAQRDKLLAAARPACSRSRTWSR